MPSRVSSCLATLTSLFLLSTGGLVVAQITVPNCTSPLWQWSFNSIGQSPCTVVAYLMATCYGGTFRVDPILNSTFSYLGPKSEEANLCWCNTVSFDLFSACGACQGGSLRSWSGFSDNCTRILDPSTFPNPVPPTTRVPQWALQDITLVNLWNVTAALAIGDTPEIFPGQLVGTSVSSSVSASSPISSASTFTPVSATSVSSSSGSGSNAGAIAGGVIAGVLAIAAIAGLALVFRRKKARARAQAPSQPAAFVVEDASPPPSASQVHPAAPYDHTRPGPMMTLYDPNNPSTYPSTPDVNVPAGSYNGYSNGNNLASLQPLRPQQGGYHGLPTV